MQIQVERHSRLQFPVHKITAKTPEELFEILPGLRRYFQNIKPTRIPVKDFVDGTTTKHVDGYEPSYRGAFADDLVKVIKYIVLVYDPDTDLINEFPDDFRLLKESAAKEAGFHRNKDGEFPLYVQDIFDFREKQVVSWIVDYLRVKKNHIWQEIKFLEQELEELYRKRSAALLKGEIDKDSMPLIKIRIQEKEDLYKRFYAEHTDLKKATQDELYPISPENVFKELKIPQEVWMTKQVQDVPKDTGVNETHN